MATFDPEKIRLDALQDTIGLWADKAFPNSSLASMYAHLLDEVERELPGAVLGGNPNNVAEECADAFMILLHICHRCRVSLSDAVALKFEEIQTRTYNTPDPKGFIRHDEEPTDANPNP